PMSAKALLHIIIGAEYISVIIPVKQAGPHVPAKLSRSQPEIAVQDTLTLTMKDVELQDAQHKILLSGRSYRLDVLPTVGKLVLMRVKIFVSPSPQTRQDKPSTHA